MQASRAATSSSRYAVRGPMLVVGDDGGVVFHSSGMLIIQNGTIEFAGAFDDVAPMFTGETRQSRGVICPPFIDIHTHIPQFPIRGRFVEGIPDDAPEGKLLAGLQRNVFPVEARTIDYEYVRQVVAEFARDTLSHGVVGGCTYMTPFASAVRTALQMLNPMWSVGMVMMNQNCPLDLRTDEQTFEADVRLLAKDFGRRLVLTDRFAVAVDSHLRRRGSALARELKLRTQTHLNEQLPEKYFVEQTLYPRNASYTDVYLQDGLLDHQCILAHCIEMTANEWRIVRETKSVVAHCPTSNLLLGSNVMPLDALLSADIDYAIATDVGASPTQSMLAEIGRFLAVHKTAAATPEEALYRATRAPARIMNLDLGVFEPGRPASFIEIDRNVSNASNAADAIRAIIPANLDAPVPSVSRVTLDGNRVYERQD